MLGLGVRDLTGGFKVFRREVLEAIDPETIPSLGYAFQVETTYRAIRAGFRVVEVPIVFRDRRVGESKMTGAIVLEAARRVPEMRLRERNEPLGLGSEVPAGTILFEVTAKDRIELRQTRVRRLTVTGKLPDVTDANFQADVLEADGPVLVDFWAPWCGPCRVVHPILEEMAAERDGELTVLSLNVDDNQQTAGRYEVLSIPTLILFRDGAEAKRVVGALPKRRLEAELEPALV